MQVRSWPVLRCVAMLSLSPSKLGPAASRLWLAGGNTAAGSGGAAHSALARELLSELAIQLGMDCPAHLWTPRGQGKPHHPNLPPHWCASISHSKGRVIVGLAQFPFGLDLERTLARRARRLEGLIEMLPEPAVRAWIHAHPRPHAAFYQAWTLYESLFKLNAHSAVRELDISALRLQLSNAQRRKFTVWQDNDWTLAVAGDRATELVPDPTLLFPGLRRMPVTIADPAHI